jgi:Icc protein
VPTARVTLGSGFYTDYRTELLPYEILQLTDTHLFADPDGEHHGVHTRNSLRRVLAAALDKYPAPDAILMTGDLSQDYSRGAYLAIRELLAQVPAPVYFLPGNHDDPALMAEILGTGNFHYCEPLRLGNWLLPMLDTWDGDRAGGLVGAEALAALDRQLESSTLPHALVCLHHQPVPVHCKWLDSVGLDDGDRLMEVIGRHPRVRGVVWGHIHQQFEDTVGEVQLMGSPSTCFQFLPRQDTFDVDTLPPGYRRICLHDDGRIESSVLWVDPDPA